MSGIWGFTHKKHRDYSSRNERMRQALKHRGPDHYATFQAPGVVMGVNGLGIEQPEPRLHQGSPDERFAVVLDGQIYNIDDIRSRFPEHGQHLKRATTSQTIAQLYGKMGSDLIGELRGMFALAVLDRTERRLTLARDRMGEKPLYYSDGPEGFTFSSELKGLLASGAVDFRLDPESIYSYFLFQYIPEPRTAVAGVRKVPAGQVLEIDLDTSRTKLHRYWDFSDVRAVVSDPVDAVAAALEEAASLTTASDGPVGISLSSGIDSILLAALLARKRTPVHAFTVGYPGHPGNDERPAARRIASHLGLDFHEIEISADDVIETFPVVVLACDDPIADTAAPCYWAISREARRQGVPSIFQGYGTDEMMWGVKWARKAAELGSCTTSGDDGPVPFYATHDGYLEAHARMPLIMPAQTLQSIGDLSPLRELHRRPGESAEGRISTAVVETYMRENSLTQGDRLTMCHGVERRLMFTDSSVVDTVFGLRAHRSDLALAPKEYVRKAALNWVPSWMAERPKMPFETPVGQWSGRLFHTYGPLVDGGALVDLGILRADVARDLLDDVYEATRPTPVSYKALVLELWVREMLKLPGVRTA
ncbi:asparagine synthase (glutamine-hydrolyzing) [Streptomyces sp. NPDC052299]|uniref:asparagine synthase (glutamine-hydrolyzing) n=1 Tax=Streptomyces sp. NPDC052299 TaxID=3155054 RepID=UPI00342FED4D